MLQKIKQLFPNFFVQESEDLTINDMKKLYNSAVEHEIHPALTETQPNNIAQLVVNDALARYCELCRKGFAHPGLAKNHKRLKHK